MTYPLLGFGVGLRTKHYDHILENWPAIDWFEVISENYMVPGGRPLFILDRIRERYPVVMHGVSMSLGSTDSLNPEHLTKLKKLADRCKPAWISDHLCWTGTGGHNAHDLLPLPYTEETLKHLADKIKQAQDFLGRQILVENVSSYVEFTHSTMTEWDFLTAVANEADCKILLDINNIYVSAKNHSFDPLVYLKAMPKDRIGQFHLAGHSDKGTHLLDTHDHPVKDDVWQLYSEALKLFGPVTTMIERDDNIPPFPELMNELNKAKEIFQNIHDPRTTNTQTDSGSFLEADHRS